MGFEILPSIDIESGRAVKRVRGVKGTGLVIGDPLKIAEEFAAKGARWVHVVDLDAAERGYPVNLHIIKRIKDELDLMIQYGGGLRSLESVEEVVSIGVDRIIVSSAWIRDPLFLDRAAKLIGAEKILAAVEELRDGRIASYGWLKPEDITVDQAIEILEERSNGGYLYTQVWTEGTMKGPNLARAARVRALTSKFLVYAGGVSSVQDIIDLRRLGFDGVVVGMAVYYGRVRLDEVICLAEKSYT